MNIKQIIAKNIFLFCIWDCVILFFAYFPTQIYNDAIKYNDPLIKTIIITTFLTMMFMFSILFVYFSLKNKVEEYLLKW